jgi:hypothetical protein
MEGVQMVEENTEYVKLEGILAKELDGKYLIFRSEWNMDIGGYIGDELHIFGVENGYLIPLLAVGEGLASGKELLNIELPKIITTDLKGMTLYTPAIRDAFDHFEPLYEIDNSGNEFEFYGISNEMIRKLRSAGLPVGVFYQHDDKLKIDFEKKDPQIESAENKVNLQIGLGLLGL